MSKDEFDNDIDWDWLQEKLIEFALNRVQVRVWVRMRVRVQEHLHELEQKVKLNELKLTELERELELLKTKKSPDYAKKLPKWTLFLSEEWQSFLFDNRQAWYADRPLNWRLYLIVSWKTLNFVVVEVFYKQSKRMIEQRSQPLYRPRLFGK